MAAYDRYTAIGAREDLTDVIYDISPTDTPIMSSIGKTKATSVYHEWQTDSLAAATTANALVEGASATEATMGTTRTPVINPAPSAEYPTGSPIGQYFSTKFGLTT